MRRQRRRKSFAKAPAPAPAPAPAAKVPAAKKASARTPAAPRDTLADDDIDKVVAALLSRPRSQPADRDALQRHIVSVLKHKVTAGLGDAVIRQLEQRGLIGFSGNKVQYALSGAGS